MDISLEMYNLPKLKKEQKFLLMSKKIEFVIKNLPINNSSEPDILVNSTKHSKKN